MALFARRRRRAVTASAARLTAANSQYAKRLAQPWQARALDYYDRVGELRYASSFYARQLSRIRIIPGLLQDDGTVEPIESGPPVERLNQIQDPDGGRSRLQYDYGRLMFVTGEGFLFGDMLETPRERWRFLWNDEIKIDEVSGVAQRVKAGSREPTGEVGVAYRLWTPHPRHSDEADSPMRAVLDVAEELLLLTASVRGTALTRLTNGLLVLASELSPAPLEDGGDEDPEQSPFMAALTEHIQAQIENPGTPEAKVPFVVEGPYEYARDGISWIKTHDPATDYMERELRIEAVKRMALGLDMPPEVLLGMTEANHWTAKQVQHDMWRSHGAPIAERFCDDINAAYLRPALREDGFRDAERVVVIYDDSQVVISPDRTEDAFQAHDRGLISDDGARELIAIEPSMAPSDEEMDRYLAIKLRQPGIIDPKLVPAPPPGPAPSPNGKADAADGPPEPTRGRSVSRQEARTASIVGAAALALRNCRAKAGSRLITRTSRAKCDECKELIRDVPSSMVASALGWEMIEEMGAKDPIGLVKGGTDEFKGILEEWGVDTVQAAALCQRLEAYAAKTLFEAEQPELPPGFVTQVSELNALADL